MPYQIDIKRNKYNKTELTKALRTLSPQIKLKQAIEMEIYINNHGTVTLVAGIGKKVANHIKKQMNIEGIEAIVKEPSINTPMIIFPSTNQKWEWGGFHSIQKAI